MSYETKYIGEKSGEAFFYTFNIKVPLAQCSDIFVSNLENYKENTSDNTINLDSDYYPIQYAGYSSGKDSGYIHSSNVELEILKDREPVNLNYLLETFESVRYVHYQPTLEDAANKEYNYLKDNDAKDNPLFFNQTNGGGTYTKGAAAQRQENELHEKYFDAMKSKTSYEKDRKNFCKIGECQFQKVDSQELLKVTRLKDEPRAINESRILQVRKDWFVSNSIEKMKEDLTVDNCTEKWPYIFRVQDAELQFCEEKQQYDIIRSKGSSLYLNGVHRTTAGIEHQLDIEWNVIEIPYSEIDKMSQAQIQKFALLFNPRREREENPSELEDLVETYIACIVQDELYTYVGDKKIPVYNHERIASWLDKMNVSGTFNKGDRRKLLTLVKKKYSETYDELGNLYSKYSDNKKHCSWNKNNTILPCVEKAIKHFDELNKNSEKSEYENHIQIMIRQSINNFQVNHVLEKVMPYSKKENLDYVTFYLAPYIPTWNDKSDYYDRTKEKTQTHNFDQAKEKCEHYLNLEHKNTEGRINYRWVNLSNDRDVIETYPNLTSFDELENFKFYESDDS